MSSVAGSSPQLHSRQATGSQASRAAGGLRALRLRATILKSLQWNVPGFMSKNAPRPPPPHRTRHHRGRGREGRRLQGHGLALPEPARQNCSLLTSPAGRSGDAALGYSPSPMAQALKRGRSRLIGLVVADVTNPFSVAVLRGAERACQDAGYLLMLFNLGNDGRPRARGHRGTAVVPGRRPDPEHAGPGPGRSGRGDAARQADGAGGPPARPTADRFRVARQRRRGAHCGRALGRPRATANCCS